MINTYTYKEYYLASRNNDIRLAEKRLEIVKSAELIGIKPTARLYSVAANTVRKWKRRYDSDLPTKSLSNISTRPHKLRNPLSQSIANKIIQTTSKMKGDGKVITANNVKRKAKIKESTCSNATITRYINKALGKRNKKVRKGNNKKTDWKRDLNPFQLIQIDIKYLDDIPNLTKLFRKNKNMPKYQITARDVATGYVWIAFARNKGVYETNLFLNNVIVKFFKDNGLDMSQTTIQTDNGREFTNYSHKTMRENKKTIFTQTVEKYFRKHKLIIPGHCTANSDVESFHWTIERDFYGFEDFVSVNDLISKANEYVIKYSKKINKHRGYSPKSKIVKKCGLKRIIKQNVKIMTLNIGF